jgi:2-polyprenyl-6-methoxyphenol hydroxylase-like FAD-dependent oxidoreductase
MSKTFDVCIRGDGVVGRTLALLLARERLRVALVTRPPALLGGPSAADVRAYALNSASRHLLETLRVWPDLPFATPVSEMQVWGDNGGQIDFSAASLGEDALAWIVDVPALEQQLIQAVRYQPQIELVLAPVKAPLTVICEGKHSASREQLGAQWTVKPYPQKAIAARLEAEKPHGGIARQWFAGGDILALLPLGGMDGNSVALVWSVSLERADRLEKMSPQDFCTALQAVYGEEIVQVLGTLTLSSERASWPLALSNAAHWVGPGWALAGDAAHTVHPLSGQGLNLGLGDVASLAEVLGQREYWRALGDEKLLRRYERARKGDVMAMDAVTDGLHGLFAQTAGPWQALRNWGMKGFAQSGPLKRWMARQAAGL